MRILIVVSYYKPAYVYGGPVHSISTLCEALISAGATVSVITTDANGEHNLPGSYRGTRYISGVSVTYCRRDLPGYFFYSRELARTCYSRIRQDSVDIVYIASNWGYPFQPACRASYKSNTPYVVSPRASFRRSAWKGTFAKKCLYHTFFERRWIQRAQRLHYTTVMELNDSSWLRLRPSPVVVPNSVSIAEFEHLPPRGGFRNRHGISEDASVVIYLGRVEPAKGLPLALRALPCVLSQYPKLTLVIAGPEEEDHIAYLRQQALDLGIREHVVFTGLLDPIQRTEALVDSDFFLLPSYSENFGMAALEAMACGLPVIVSNQVGLADVVYQENAGLITQLGPESISAALLTLLDNPGLASQMGKTGKTVARRDFAPDAVAQRMLQEFDDVLAVRRPG